MKIIKTLLISYEKHNNNESSHADRQSDDIDGAERLALPKIPECGLEIIFKHANPPFR
jgi:hypothetical protein